MSDEIDSCKYLYLRELGEPEDNALRLIVEEAKVGGETKDIEVAGSRTASEYGAIESDASCRLFELTWPTYVAYSVRNESFCAMDDSEKRQGRLFCIYSKSHFLDYVARGTFADDVFPGPFRHWGISCLNHIIDVVSTSEPNVRQLRPE